jgi:serine/threonine protein kinase
MINQVVANYTIKYMVGSGGMAEVYYAENRLGLPAAVKVLKKEFIKDSQIQERFVNEAKIVKTLQHNHIRRVLDICELNGRPVIVMEYLEGQTLKELIDKGKITEYHAKKYFQQSVEALKATHSKGIVHRDIKPSNIFITKDNDVKILDYGIAKSNERGFLTRTNQILGTIIYMSPEQIKNPKDIGVKSDVYSLAVTFYHALSGKAPYDLTAESEYKILKKIVSEDLDLSLIPKNWRQLMSSCLQKEPQFRPELTSINFINITIIENIPNEVSQEKQESNSKRSQIFKKKWLFYLFLGLSLPTMIYVLLPYIRNKRPTIEIISIPDKNYMLGKYEVTIGQYLAFCKATGSHWPEWLEKGNQYNIYTGSDNYYKKVGMSEYNDNHPVTGVSAIDADAFCKWMGGRLPTEYEWEYAAKGGENYKYSGGSYIDAVAWSWNNSEEKTHPVGKKDPNGYGLYDMSGNVWEWTSKQEFSKRVTRGGSWKNEAKYSWVSSRAYGPPDGKSNTLGFRIAFDK